MSESGVGAPTVRGSAAVRLVVRHVSEAVLARGLRWQAATAPDRFDCLVLQVVLSANLAHLPYRMRAEGWQGLLASAPLRRPVSVMAVARSMNLPYETVRRRTRALVEAGLIEADAAGCLVPLAVFAPPAAAALPGADAAALRAMVAALARSGHGPSLDALAAAVLPPDPQAIPTDVVARMLLDFTIRILESFTGLYGDVLSGSIVAAIVAANVRHILSDPALAREHAAHDRIPPDSMRRPIALRTLARALELPFETVRRRTVALGERGFVDTLADGVIVPTRVLVDDAHRRNNQFITAQIERMLESMVRLSRGVDLA